MADMLTALSVFLVFLTFLYNGIDKEISRLLEREIPPAAKEILRSRHAREIKRVLWAKCIPVAVVFGGTFYVILPQIVTLMLCGRVSLWHFDPLATLIIMIGLGLLAMFIYIVSRTIKLGKRIKEVNVN